MMSKINEITEIITSGKVQFVTPLVEKALADGIEANDILQAMIEAMEVVGKKFTDGDLFVPEMLVSAMTMQKGIEVIKPFLTGDAGTSRGRCLIGTVAGDVHDIGKNLVCMMIESSGFEVIDLGVDVSKERFIANMQDADIICCSALLTNTLEALKDTVKEIKTIDKTKKVLVGGAPVTQNFADEIGADGYANDAASAAQKAKEILMADN